MNRIRWAMEKLLPLPGGNILMSWMVGWAAPYSGTVGARIVELRPGFARVQMRDRRRVRNHLECVHAVALMNLAELTTGLAFIAGLPDDAQGIVTGFQMEYLKKARGTLTGECTCTPPSGSERGEYEVVGELKNTDGEVVARGRARWMVGPARKG